MQTNVAAPWLRGFDAAWLDAIRCMPIAQLREALTQESIRRGLVSAQGKPLAFVPQEALPNDVAYESWIAATGCVPTRDNLHDRFNALVWLSAPLTKARLNALQWQAIEAQASQQTRGALRDAATIWDENLAVIVAQRQADALINALRSHDWNLLFHRMRDRWMADWQVFVFGHALLEKLEKPFKSITAHIVVVNAPSVHIAWPMLDASLVARLDATWTPSMFHHLPVLGIPGWDDANDNPNFYHDPAVFRPARK